ncbi:MAG: hypothetical protein J5594_02540 [Elusimicrobiaceae bacterium]|nr:hypothetical protein [Elusimicrobiaceae bacterium]
MKKLFVLVLMLFVSVGVFADTKNNSLYIGVEAGSYKYEEPHMDYPISDKGDKIGVSLEWVGRSILEASGLVDSEDNSFATFEARYVTGKTDYKGYVAYFNPEGGIDHADPVEVKGVEDWYLEGRITVGQVYNFMDIGEFWPYIGFGYRRLVNNTEKNDSEAGYKRISQYFYVPIGFRLGRNFDSGFKIYLIGEFDWLIHGEQASHIGDLISQMYPGVETNYVYNYQRKGWGARVSVKAEVPITQQTGIFVEPYFRMWKIQNSGLGEGDVNTYDDHYEYWYNIPFIEPFNVTKEVGIKAGFYF